jgi:hypothetical protein
VITGSLMPNALKLEAQFNRLSISGKDFEEAADYLKAYSDELSETLRRAVLVSAIIAYARPFTTNKGGTERLATSTLMGNPKQILSSEEFILHDKILGLRNEAVAHSDYDRKPTRLVDGIGIGRGFLTRSKPFDVLSEKISIATFRAMCKKMRDHCDDTRFDLHRELSFKGG